ncbi:threonine-phosphate decarboxylase CobD [Oryzomicrobium sp.]|uniref:threonine-phosphate decarboxylase CobD n=1 Tax=Oryzomicrobium sp. TaxID=1911578 RepID=UPI0025E959BC|nr:threonine-phosphate decarboxylase CobD [Oryzomicrobium sp.]MCE1242938.1 threonine-phosphate decarboxylase CobD [Oryzomicrobium sp.]
MLEHGGRLHAASLRYGIPRQDWLDLSTGINPAVYPLPTIPPEAWQRLPEGDDGLEAAARAAYGADPAAAVLALPGSQAAIQALPALRPASSVAVLAPTYAEHPYAWETRTGHGSSHRLATFAADGLLEAAARHDVVVLGNPNNPDGTRFSRAALLDAARLLQARGGWLVVDEAFADADSLAGGAGAADATDDGSVAPFAGSPAYPGLIVLRSLGKFYGLAGARVGFVLLAPALAARLAEALGPWPVAGPSRWAARAALADGAWQRRAAADLGRAAARLANLLAPLGPVAGCALFQTLTLGPEQAAALYDHLARRGLLARLFAPQGRVRFGLPSATSANSGDSGDSGNPADLPHSAAWQRLARALDDFKALR